MGFKELLELIFCRNPYSTILVFFFYLVLFNLTHHGNSCFIVDTGYYLFIPTSWNFYGVVGGLGCFFGGGFVLFFVFCGWCVVGFLLLFWCVGINFLLLLYVYCITGSIHQVYHRVYLPCLALEQYYIFCIENHQILLVLL